MYNYRYDRNTNLETYHFQSNKDWYANRDSKSMTVAQSSMKQILAAYDEFMNDLMCESQEAY